MRYSISNAIPHNPKSKKHPYENLVKYAFSALFCGVLLLFKKISCKGENKREERLHLEKKHLRCYDRKSEFEITGRTEGKAE